MPTRTTVPTFDPSVATTNHHTPYRLDDKIYSCQQVVDTSPTAKYPTYVDSSRSYVVANTSKCLDVSWPYSVSPSSGIIQPIQVMNSPQLDLHKPCGKIPKHPSSVDGLSSNHSSSPVSSGLLTPKVLVYQVSISIQFAI